MSSHVQFFLLSFLARASKISETLRFWLKNSLQVFLTLSFFGLEFFENGQKKPGLLILLLLPVLIVSVGQLLVPAVIGTL